MSVHKRDAMVRLKTLDTNKDGKVTWEEFLKSKEDIGGTFRAVYLQSSSQWFFFLEIQDGYRVPVLRCLVVIWWNPSPSLFVSPSRHDDTAIGRRCPSVNWTEHVITLYTDHVITDQTWGFKVQGCFVWSGRGGGGVLPVIFKKSGPPCKPKIILFVSSSFVLNSLWSSFHSQHRRTKEKKIWSSRCRQRWRADGRRIYFDVPPGGNTTYVRCRYRCTISFPF